MTKQNKKLDSLGSSFLGMTTSSLKKVTLFGLGFFLLTQLGFSAAGNPDLIKDWSAADDCSALGGYTDLIVSMVMYVFASVSIVLAGMTCYGLYQSGDWRSFWNKIAGCVLLFAIPFVIKSFIAIEPS